MEVNSDSNLKLQEILAKNRMQNRIEISEMNRSHGRKGSNSPVQVKSGFINELERKDHIEESDNDNNYDDNGEFLLLTFILQEIPKR